MTAEEAAAPSGSIGSGLLGILGQFANGFGVGLAGKSVAGRTDANNFSNPANPATGATGQSGVVPAASVSAWSQAMPFVILGGIAVAVAFVIRLAFRK